MNKKYLPSALILYLNYFIHGVGCSILGQAVIKEALATAWGVEAMAITAISAALGLGRLISQLSVEMCDLFLEEVLGEHADMELDEETMATIRQLFDNNLNISETARQLYIHRNTLVYRLERIEKKISLDIRTFEDAMLFKIAMMVRTHRNSVLGSCQNKNEVIQ
mgnify:CR=1 FL=1